MTAAPTFGIEVVGMTKRFGALVALDQVSLKVRPGSVHALLGENGAGKSTLVKCVMGFYRPDEGQVIVGAHEVVLANPREAHAEGIGMVYQHFTLVPSMTVLENLVMARADVPSVIDWKSERAALDAFLATMPFSVPVDRPVAHLAAGEKQKVEILKQIYLRSRFLILDEPTSVLTPQEADEILGFLKSLVGAGTLTVLIITHKFREVLSFADEVSILRQGRLVGGGKVADLGVDAMAKLMIGEDKVVSLTQRAERAPGEACLAIEDLDAVGDGGTDVLSGLSLSVRRGEIVGIAGVSGNGQSELMEVLSGQRRARSGTVRVFGASYAARRSQMLRHKVGLLPEEPLRNACVGRMSVADNMALRSFDRPPFARFGILGHRRIRQAAEALIARYRVKASSPDVPIATLSGGNVQRAVLARELAGDAALLIVANPVFGLDFQAVRDIHGQILAARNRGAGVLLISEDLDELLELADRILVMSQGRIVHETSRSDADRTAIGRSMAGH